MQVQINPAEKRPNKKIQRNQRGGAGGDRSCPAAEGHFIMIYTTSL